MFTVCFLSSAVRCQPLSRALCLQKQKSHLEEKTGDFSGFLASSIFSNFGSTAQNSLLSLASRKLGSWVASLLNRGNIG
ncbi:hypothetical protein FKN12_18580 [Vibrio sp. 2-2(8)]|nr:hypothetical protein [Vibrio sp. 2-2(8)]